MAVYSIAHDPSAQVLPAAIDLDGATESGAVLPDGIQFQPSNGTTVYLPPGITITEISFSLEWEETTTEPSMVRLSVNDDLTNDDVLIYEVNHAAGITSFDDTVADDGNLVVGEFPLTVPANGAVVGYSFFCEDGLTSVSGLLRIVWISDSWHVGGVGRSW